MKTSTIVTAVACLALSGGVTVSAQAAAPAHRPGSAGAGAQRCVDRSVDTLTTMVLRKHTIHRGDADSATVHVTSPGAVDPRGTIELGIYQSQSGTGLSRTLTDGVATLPIPRDLGVGEFSVRASSVPADCTKWRKSRSNEQHLTVLR
jgi:hypothetical protein